MGRCPSEAPLGPFWALTQKGIAGSCSNPLPFFEKSPLCFLPRLELLKFPPTVNDDPFHLLAAATLFHANYVTEAVRGGSPPVCPPPTPTVPVQSLMTIITSEVSFINYY